MLICFLIHSWRCVWNEFFSFVIKNRKTSLAGYIGKKKKSKIYHTQYTSCAVVKWKRITIFRRNNRATNRFRVRRVITSWSKTENKKPLLPLVVVVDDACTGDGKKIPALHRVNFPVSTATRDKSRAYETSIGNERVPCKMCCFGARDRAVCRVRVAVVFTPRVYFV